MILNFALTPIEYREAQLTYRTRMAKSRVLFRNLYVLSALSATLAFFLLLSGNRWGAALFAAIGFAMLFERVFFWRWRLNRLRPGIVRDGEAVEVRIDRDGLSWESPTNRGDQRWAYINSCRETKNLVLLQVANGEALPIPKRAFPSGEYSRFIQLLRGELMVKLERESTDALLLKFAVSWGLGALLVITLGIGYLHTFLFENRLPGRTPTYPTIVAAKSVPATLDQLKGRGTIFLVPIGDLDSATPLKEAREKFQYKYRVFINPLKPIPLPEWAENQERNQYAAEDLVLAMQLAYPKLAADPDAILIGVTDADMYISAMDWRYAFSFRDEERFGVISTAHLDEADEDDDKPATADVVNKRLYKVLARDLGVLHFRLQPAHTYKSILGSVDDPYELDEIGDDYLKSDAEVRADLHVHDGDPCFIVRQYTEPERAHEQSGALRACSGSYKELNLETIQVDLRYGLLLDQRTDFLIDEKTPLELTRVVRTQDDRSRAFGVGGSHSLNLFLVGDKWPFTRMQLVLPDGGRSEFKRSNWGFGYWDARYQNRDSNRSRFSYSRIDWAWPGWKLERGTDVYRFPDRPNAMRPEQTALESIKHGESGTLFLNRDANGNILRATFPGRDELLFTNDAAGRIKKILEHGKPSNQFFYEYEPGGHLSRVTDAQGNVSDYGYDARHLVSMKLNGADVATFEYDSQNRVRREVLNGRVYEFHYQSGFSGQVGSVSISDSAGPTRLVRITGNEYTLDTKAEPPAIKQDTQK